MSLLPTTLDYKKILLDEGPVIDVRAPVEFSSGAFPLAANLPLMFDEERKKVGTCYKQHGREAAINLGFKLVSGDNKQAKVNHWLEFIKKQKSTVYITCFRGGLRSQISQKWISEQNAEVVRFEKGYKHFRQWVVDESKNYFLKNSLKVLTGPTGSGKTVVLQKIKNYPTLDLEDLESDNF